MFSVEVIPYALPFRRPYVTARGRLARREMVLLRLRSEDGLLGLGEAVPLSLRGGIGLGQVVGELEALAGRDSLDEATLRGDAIGLSAPARCAALTALLDLRGRMAAGAGAPAGTSHPVECNATLVAGEPSAVAADASPGRKRASPPSSSSSAPATTSDRYEPYARRWAGGAIRVDANAAWDVETATATLAAIEPFDVELAEQPVATHAELAKVGAATSIPIAGDECIESCVDAEAAARAGACDFASVKLSKVGGPEAAIEIAEVMPTYLSSALDGPVGIAAAAQVAQTLEAAGSGGPQLAHGLATQRLFASTIASVECEIHDGMLQPPPGPGLGVEIDEDALGAHRI